MDELEARIARIEALLGIALDSPPFDTLDGGLTPPEDEPDHRKRFYDQAFEQWWTHYWNRNGKQGARRAFEKRVKAMRTLPEQAVEALCKLADGDRKRFEGTEAWEWRRNLHAATWLNQERWTDEPPNGRLSKQQGVVDDIKQRYGLE